ncbi:hypothetical protein HMN09_00631700 [Mycena chlorophos]|uniref:Uncharacterized protein n=1 Tax=Mycena chlorophos TaxID=658473 RepID=A0A8H6T7M6_MYCCL|nr:hypothetical protein HMN09_00631700 [Mycena chlorophos]
MSMPSSSSSIPIPCDQQHFRVQLHLGAHHILDGVFNLVRRLVVCLERGLGLFAVFFYERDFFVVHKLVVGIPVFFHLRIFFFNNGLSFTVFIIYHFSIDEPDDYQPSDID